MRISDVERMLAAERERLGDAEVVLHGYYGAESAMLAPMAPGSPDPELAQLGRERAPDGKLHLWTDITTG